MKKLISSLALSLALIASPALAHHPAEDILDPEIWNMIDEMVSDTPHADLTFDDTTMGPENDDDLTVIVADSVDAAEALLDDGFLGALSLLEPDDVDELTVTITFGKPDSFESTLLATSSSDDDDDNGNGNGDGDGDDDNGNNQYTDSNDWGGPVTITINDDLDLEQDN